MAPTIPPTRFCCSGGSTTGTSSSPDSGEEVASKRKLKRWLFIDEMKILTALAELRRENMGELPPASVLHEVLQTHSIKRENFTVPDISKKVYSLSEKFEKEITRVLKFGRRPCKGRNREIFLVSMQVWPEKPRSVAKRMVRAGATLHLKAAGRIGIKIKLRNYGRRQ